MGVGGPSTSASSRSTTDRSGSIGYDGWRGMSWSGTPRAGRPRLIRWLERAHGANHPLADSGAAGLDD